MTFLIALTIGVLGGSAFFLLLRRSWVRIVLGIALLGHAVNFFIFTTGGLSLGSAPIIPNDQSILPGGSADPLPQALILTAIVIGFGMQAFFIVLARAAYEKNRTLDVDQLEEAES